MRELVGPVLLTIAVGALMVFVLPAFPGAPDACLNQPGNACAQHMPGLMWTVFGIPCAVLFLATRRWRR
jgi:hypothetical protein